MTDIQSIYRLWAGIRGVLKFDRFDAADCIRHKLRALGFGRIVYRQHVFPLKLNLHLPRFDKPGNRSTDWSPLRPRHAGVSWNALLSKQVFAVEFQRKTANVRNHLGQRSRQQDLGAVPDEAPTSWRSSKQSCTCPPRPRTGGSSSSGIRRCRTSQWESFSASNYLCQSVEGLAELAGKSRRLGYWCKTGQKSGTVQLLITETTRSRRRGMNSAPNPADTGAKLDRNLALSNF